MPSRFKPYTLEELRMRQQPELLIPHALAAGGLLIATGEHRFFAQLGRILGSRAVAFHAAASDHRDIVYAWIDAARRREGSPAVLVHFPDNYPGFDPYWLAAGDAVIDAESPTLAKVVKLRDFDGHWKSLRLRGREAAIEERF